MNKNNTTTTDDAAFRQSLNAVTKAFDKLQKACDEAPDGTPLSEILHKLVEEADKKRTPLERIHTSLLAVHMAANMECDLSSSDDAFLFEHIEMAYEDIKEILKQAIADAQDKAYNRGYNNGIRHASRK